MIIIHHGSGVENALSELVEGYDLVKPPYEDLKVDAIRDLASNLGKVWPQQKPALMAGPLDTISKADILDILLKSIEEPLEGAPYLILWAHDLGSVSPTIRSRCGEKYYYAPPLKHELYEDGKRLLNALNDKSIRDVVVTLNSVKKGSESEFIKAYLEVVVDTESYHLYDSGIHSLVSGRASDLQIMAYFLRRM